jgi:hypothetical protein
MARFLAEDASRRPKQSGRASKSVANWNGVCDGRKPSKLFKFGRIKRIPKLLEPAPIDEMNAALNEYLDRDSAPRVRKAIAAIVSNWDQICNSRLDIWD